MSTAMLYCIANPAAARGTMRRRASEVLSFFNHNHLEATFLWTEKPRHGVHLARELTDSGATRIVSIGGDGTAFEVINGIMQSANHSRVAMGILPLGTGNSFLRDFSITSWEDAAKRIVNGETRCVDIGKAIVMDKVDEGPIYFHNMVGLGLVAEACRLRHTRYPWMGRYAYHGAFFHLLFGMKDYPIRFGSGNGEPSSIQSPLLAVCNSQYTGHNMRISPRSNVQDGGMELLYTHRITAWPLLKLFLRLPSGDHLKHPHVRMEVFQGLEIQIEGIDYFMVDGEIVNGSRLRIDVLPSALPLYV